MKVVHLPGRKWVTCSTGWIVIVVCFSLFGCLGLVLALDSAINDGEASVAALFFSIAFCCFLSPLFIVRAVSITPTRLRRAPQLGRPTKIPLTEITHLWPDGPMITSNAGRLMEVAVTPFAFKQKHFYDFGPQLAKMINAEWLPTEPTNHK